MALIYVQENLQPPENRISCQSHVILTKPPEIALFCCATLSFLSKFTFLIFSRLGMEAEVRTELA